jgi:hypothetical protein
MATSREETVPSVQFEANDLPRTYERILPNPDIARTERVANAWDAGASKDTTFESTKKWRIESALL